MIPSIIPCNKRKESKYQVEDMSFVNGDVTYVYEEQVDVSTRKKSSIGRISLKAINFFKKSPRLRNR